MTTAQIDMKRRITNEAQWQQALVDAVLTPEIREKLQDSGKRMSEALNLQVEVRNMLTPSLEAMVHEQNQRIAHMLDSTGLRKAFAGIKFDLPDGLPEQIAAFREQVVAEAAGESSADDASGGGLGRLAEDREAIIICLQRIGFALEGFAYLPHSPIPPIVGYLLLMLAVLGEVANEKLSEDEEGRVGG